jgi:hypothetical protein
MRLNKGTIVLMISLAAFGDAVQLLFVWIDAGTLTNRIVAFIFVATFALWFKMKGVKLLGKKKAVATATSWIAEAIPIVGLLPGLSVQVLVMIGITVKEDATKKVKEVPQNIRNFQRLKELREGPVRYAKRRPKKEVKKAA